MPTREQTIAWEKQVRIDELKYKLAKDDYIDNKLAEANAKYVVTGDSTDVVRIYNEYRDLIEQRQAWRDEINALEKELSEVTNNVEK